MWISSPISSRGSPPSSAADSALPIRISSASSTPSIGTSFFREAKVKIPAWFASGSRIIKEPWLICLIVFHIALLMTIIITRKNVNFQLCLSVLAFAGVLLAERINRLLGQNWKSFAGQNYFDPNGIFISVLWSGPLLLITMVIVVNTLLTLCQLIIKWKRAELRHRARLARGKQD